MRLKSIEIANFKAFGKEFQTIPIKPITLGIKARLDEISDTSQFP